MFIFQPGDRVVVGHQKKVGLRARGAVGVVVGIHGEQWYDLDWDMKSQLGPCFSPDVLLPYDGDTNANI